MALRGARYELRVGKQHRYCLYAAANTTWKYYYGSNGAMYKYNHGFCKHYFYSSIRRSVALFVGASSSIYSGAGKFIHAGIGFNNGYKLYNKPCVFNMVSVLGAKRNMYSSNNTICYCSPSPTIAVSNQTHLSNINYYINSKVVLQTHNALEYRANNKHLAFLLHSNRYMHIRNFKEHVPVLNSNRIVA